MARRPVRPFDMHNHHDRSVHDYLPAAGHDLFLPLYDPLTSLLGMSKARRVLMAQGQLVAGMRVLDVGCGTGSFLALLARQAPGVSAVGLDPDPRALDRARAKLHQKGPIQLDQGYAGKLPYKDKSFARVFSSFMFHHLTPEEQAAMLRESERVLEPGGRLELLDFAGKDQAHQGILRLFHASQRLAGNQTSSVHSAMRNAGFTAARTLRTDGRLFPSAYYQAQK